MKKIFSEYNLSPEAFDIIPFGNGLINKTWRIKNLQEDYILQKINATIFKQPEAIAFNIKLLSDYLASTHPGYLFIQPVKTKANEYMAFIEGEGYFRLFAYVKNSHTIDAAEKPEQAYEAGQKFGQFTKILSGFPAADLKITLPDFHNLSLRYGQFLEALERGNKSRIIQSGELINYVKTNKQIVDTYKGILQNTLFKIRVTHHDTKISNILFNDEDKGLCVIDLDTVMPGYFISDVGDMLRTYLSPVNEEEKDFSNIQIRDEYFKAIWKGYMSEMGDELSVEEKSHFIYAGKFMIYMQALRFLTDHLNDDFYYGAKYENQNFIRAGNQVTLLKRLIEKESQLAAFIS
jgi:Ser/Thr protein kinase RdoA (MazF antagonist)